MKLIPAVTAAKVKTATNICLTADSGKPEDTVVHQAKSPTFDEAQQLLPLDGIQAFKHFQIV